MIKFLLAFLVVSWSFGATAAWTPVTSLYRNGTTGQLYTNGYPPGFLTPTPTHTPTNTFTPTPTFTPTNTPTSTPTVIYAWYKIGSSQTASASATINFTVDGSAYRDFLLVGSDVIPATDAAVPWIRLANSGSYLAGGSDYAWARVSVSSAAVGVDSGDTADSEIEIGIQTGTDTGESMDFVLYLFNPASTANRKKVQFDSSAESEANVYRRFSGMGSVLSNTTAVNGIQFLFSTGDIESGTFSLYGRQN